MTPKEKAEELVERMAYSCRECDYEFKAKQCALIAVDEILWVTSTKESWFNVKGKYEERNLLNPYWVEVKQEIENL